MSMHKIKAKLSDWVRFFVYTLLVVSTLPFLGKYDETLDILSSFRTQYTCFTILLFLLISYKKKQTYQILALILCFSINFIESNWTFKPTKIVHSDLKILHSNVFTENLDHGKIITLIQEENPDIIGLQEVNHTWIKHLSENLRQYPYRHLHPQADNFGIALYSKIPFESVRTEYFDISSQPSIVSKIKINGRLVELVYTHLLPPLGKRYFKERNSQLNSIAKYSANKKNLIVFGDFNMSPSSVHFKDFLWKSKLNHSSKNILYTWPAGFTLLATPIDHIFHSQEFLLHCEKLEGVGSDHYPIFAEIRFK